jgi:hypothetical protein
MDDLHRKIQSMNRRIGQVEPKAPGLYEEGTWNPTLVGSGTAGTFTYLGQTAGTYTRIGNRIFIAGRVAISAVTVAPTGNLSIHGLPYAAATVTAGTPGGAHFPYWSLINIGGGAKVYLGGWIQNAATQIDLVVSASGGAGAVFLTGATAGIAANSDLLITGEYQAA